MGGDVVVVVVVVVVVQMARANLQESPSGSKLTFEMKTFDFLSLNFKAK
jgi:hypothetical protein